MVNKCISAYSQRRSLLHALQQQQQKNISGLCQVVRKPSFFERPLTGDILFLSLVGAPKSWWVMAIYAGNVPTADMKNPGTTGSSCPGKSPRLSKAQRSSPQPSLPASSNWRSKPPEADALVLCLITFWNFSSSPLIWSCSLK